MTQLSIYNLKACVARRHNITRVYERIWGECVETAFFVLRVDENRTKRIVVLHVPQMVGAARSFVRNFFASLLYQFCVDSFFYPLF